MRLCLESSNVALKSKSRKKHAYEGTKLWIFSLILRHPSCERPSTFSGPKISGVGSLAGGSNSSVKLTSINFDN